MDVRQQSILASNHTNWELGYHDSQPLEETRLSQVACLVGVTVAWPLFFLGGALMLTFHSVNYFKARWNQYKIITILTDQKSLEEYAERRIHCCEKQIEDLKSHARFLMERELKKPGELGLPIPQKEGFRDYLSNRLPEACWKDFPWNEFQNMDFFQKSNIPGSQDRFTLQQLEKARIQLNCLSHQISVLSNPETRLETIKKIAEMSLVKNAFKRQESKEWIARSSLWLLPSGIFWNLFFNSTNDRLTYEGNKNLLPAIASLQAYDDLVDAHNQLVRNNDFLVPYLHI